MLDAERCYLWAWDARPFPAFPLATDVWGDGENWLLGHWLNGRLANPTAGDLINAILADHGLEPADVADADGSVVGYVVSEPSAARAALEQVCEIFGLAGWAKGDRLVFRSEGAARGTVAEIEALVVPEEGPVVWSVREAAHLLPGEALLSCIDPLRDYQTATARHMRTGTPGARQELLTLSGCLEEAAAQSLVTDWLKRRWRSREEIAFALAPNERGVAPGSLVRLPQASQPGDYMVTGIDDGLHRQARAHRIDRLPRTPIEATLGNAPWKSLKPAAKPLLHFMDLPLMRGADEPWTELRLAAWCRPWRSQIAYASADGSAYEQRASLTTRGRIGELVEAIEQGVPGRLDGAGAIIVALFGGSLSSVSTIQMLNGANAAAVRSSGGTWEVIQFRDAEEIEPDVWRLSILLRGQLGTEDAMLLGAPAGAPFVMLDDAVPSAGLKSSEAGLSLTWRVGPARFDFGSDPFATQTVSGGVRAAIPLSPVHLRAARSGVGDVALTWIRRGRIAADSWEGAEIPLGEEAEAYRVEVRDDAGMLLRSAETVSPQWTYSASEIAADFGAGAGPAVFHVFQRKGKAGSPGLAAVRVFGLA